MIKIRDMFIMIKTAYLNPFSADAKEIVSKLGQVDNLDKKIDKLESIITHTPGQIIDDKLPVTIKDLAIKRIEWYLFRKTDGFDDKNYEYLLNPDIYEYDIVAFYLLCQAIAIGYGPDSMESKALLESESLLTRERLEKLNTQPNDFQSSILRKALNQFIDTNNIQWTNIKEILDYGILDINELTISNGRVILEYEDFMMEYGDKIHNRDPHSMYEVTGGLKLKTKLLVGLISLQTRKYINTVHEMSNKMVEPNQIILDLADTIKELETEAQKIKFSSSGPNNSSMTVEDKPVAYNMEAFPPCVRKCLQGIKSGGRNDAIVLFLTPFISYSRLCPGIFNMQDFQYKVTDVDPDLEITENEVLPLIYEAAQNCSPPLFNDQPQEKININSKLGFGLHSKLETKNEGETHWYTPMSCEKIKLHMSSLCTPNIDCKKIGNPLTYYNRKRKLLGKSNKGQVKEDGN